MAESSALETPQGQAIAGWQQEKATSLAGFTLAIEPPMPVDAMRRTYLEADLRADAPLTVRLNWEGMAGEHFRGPAIPAIPAIPDKPTQPFRLYLRDHPHWQGRLRCLRLTAASPFQIAQFSLYAENDLLPLERLNWPSDFALAPRRRILVGDATTEARLIVPNRLLRTLGEHVVVFSLETARGETIAKRQTAGRLPPEPQGLTDLFSGALPTTGLTGPGRLRARVVSLATESYVEDSVALHAVSAGSPLVFTDPYHYVRDFTCLRIGEIFHLFYTVGPSDGRQTEDTPRTLCQIGHAVTSDLSHWNLQAPALTIDRHDAEARLFAPALVEHDGLFYLFYTAANAEGAEAIFVATSPDLQEWTRHPGGAVYRSNTAWAGESANGFAICRAPSILRYGDTWILYVRARTRSGDDCIAAAVSHDLLQWIDAGPVLVTKSPPESPYCMEHAGRFFLFTDGGGVFAGHDPLRDWHPVADLRPPGWKGWKFLSYSGQTWALAYRDLTRGNYLQAFPVRFSDRNGATVPEYDMRHAIWIEE